LIDLINKKEKKKSIYNEYKKKINDDENDDEIKKSLDYIINKKELRTRRESFMSFS
jgi:hypothetical protein